MTTLHATAGKYYDPRACGALCDVCPLNGHRFVAPESGTNAKVAVVGKYPSDAEVKQERMFVGPAGNKLDTALRGASFRRNDLHVTNAILCQPPENDLDKLMTMLSRKSKAENKKYPTPQECCAPRLKLELARTRITNFIALGKIAVSAVLGYNGSIMAIRGTMQDLDGVENQAPRRIMPTVHPDMLMKNQRWEHVFRSDIAKAARNFKGVSSWVMPEVIYHPSPEVLRRFIADKNQLYTYDIETDGIECLTAHIRCIAIGNTEKVLVIGFRSNTRSKEDHTLWLDFYPKRDAKEITELLKSFFEDEAIVKVGQNIGYYDRLVLRSQMGIETNNIVDTMMIHRSVESELPHSLAYLAALYTDAPSWKNDREGNKIALGGESDEQLHEYCAKDVAITARVLPPLVDQLSMREQTGVYALDMQIQSICADMHAAGMFVDQAARHKEELRLIELRYNLLKDIRESVSMPGFNPGSVNQMRDLLFGKWKLVADVEEKDKFTGSGDLSTGDLILRVLLTETTVPENQREIIKLIRRYRKCMKILGTYVVKLRPSDMGADLGWDEDDDFIDAETRKKYGEVKVGIVDPRTGRMHPGYNAAVTVTGRLSSSKPLNAQNFPKAMRKMIIAAPGHILVGADMDQVELRIAAARWDVELYKRAFREGKDPHSMTAYAVFGVEFCKAAGVDEALFHRPGILVGTAYDERGKFIGDKEAMSLRNLSKAIQYASQYMAKVETVHKLIQKTELPAVHPITKKPLDDGTTDLLYAKIPLMKVRKMRDNWLKGAPEFEHGWTTEIEAYRRDGHIQEQVTGRKRDFLDGEAPNEIVNFPIQGSASGIVNLAMIELSKRIPFNAWGPGTGLINQCHDSIVVECPENKAEWVAKQLEECMNQVHDCLPGVQFSASASIGKTWKEVG